MTEFATFQLPDNRLIFIRKSAVTVVYDQVPALTGAWVEGEGAPSAAIRNGKGGAWVEFQSDPTAVVHTQTTGMPVPYTAQQVMEILYGTSG